MQLQATQAASSARFARFCWGLLAYTVIAVIWGAFVRGSISGDGCGTHWPTCGGSLLPDFSGLRGHSFSELFQLFFHPTQTYASDEVRQGILRKAIEYSHRISTGPITAGAILLLIWGYRTFPKGHPVRFSVTLSALFIVFEAVIGMALVLNKWVALDKSMMRAYMMPVHLVNTFVLLMGLTTAAWFGAGNTRISWRKQGPIAFLVLGAGAAFLYLAITGSISALGDQIYPVKDHLEAMREASLNNVPFLIQHRPRHPMSAAVCGLILCLCAGLLAHLRPSENTRRFSYLFWFGMSGQLALGVLNIVLAVPVWMQLSHLLMADMLWIAFVLLAVSALSVEVPHLEMLHVPEAVLAGERPSIKDYVALTKPRVISLLLFTTLMAMFVASHGWPGRSFLGGLWLLVATGTGLYAAAGASNAINMVCERDLDVRMERTASRPTVTEKIHPRAALWFAFGLEAFSFGLLWFTSNLLAATLALAGLVVYVIVYTLLLKRRTWSNIVIGGAAGAFPPLVGWAAASDNLSPLAWLLFALIFVWTPVHFWALALLIKDDYAKAGVPMLPVVKGDRYTVVQIGWYAVVTAAISLAPVLLHEAGWIYGLAALALNGLLLRGCARLLQTIDRPRASSLFHYSMLYLALLFLALAVDTSVGPRILS